MGKGAGKGTGKKKSRSVLPKQTWFVFFYMAVLYLIYIAAIHYARTHPIVDEPPPPAAATPER
jgi:hypothetical protein